MASENSIISEERGRIKEILEESKTVAIVGLSPKSEKASNQVARYLQEHGYRVIPIYPKEETILGEKVYRSLDEVDEHVDIVDMFRKSEIADEVAAQILKRDDVKTLWLQLELVNNDAAKRIKGSGRNVVQDRCMKIEHRELMA